AEPVAQALEAVRVERLREAGRAGLDVAVLVHVVVGDLVEHGDAVAQLESATQAQADRLAIVRAAGDVAEQRAPLDAVFLAGVHGHAFQVAARETVAGVQAALQAAGGAVRGRGRGGAVAVAERDAERGRVAETEIHAGQAAGGGDVERAGAADALERRLARVVLDPGTLVGALGAVLRGGAAAVVEHAQALVHDAGDQPRGVGGAGA